jgi:hypothetical protein
MYVLIKFVYNYGLCPPSPNSLYSQNPLLLFIFKVVNAHIL